VGLDLNHTGKWVIGSSNLLPGSVNSVKYKPDTIIIKSLTPMSDFFVLFA
jgi:hypothetical protein